MPGLAAGRSSPAMAARDAPLWRGGASGLEALLWLMRRKAAERERFQRTGAAQRLPRVETG